MDQWMSAMDASSLALLLGGLFLFYWNQAINQWTIVSSGQEKDKREGGMIQAWSDMILECLDYCYRQHTDIGHAHSTPAGTNQDDTQQQKEGMHLCTEYVCYTVTGCIQLYSSHDPMGFDSSLVRNFDYFSG